MPSEKSAIDPVTIIFIQGITVIANTMFNNFINEVSKHIIESMITKVDNFLVENIREINDSNTGLGGITCDVNNNPE